MNHTLSFKTVDDRGRLTLGRGAAGRTVVVEANADGFSVRYVRVVPEREAWLWDNEMALASVRTGIESAHRGDFTEEPEDFEAALAFAAELPDEDE
jgi:hypothetical protein